MSLQTERLQLSPVALGAVGTAATVCLVVAAGRAAVPIGVTLEPSFGGLLRPTTSGGTASAAVVLVCLAILVACWWSVVERAARQHLSLAGVAAIGLAWILPVVVGPPLLSLDAYAYLAQGEMVAAGYDPYSGGPILLGEERAASRVDPMWRAAPTPYGPVALVLFRTVAEVSDGLTAGVMLLRLLAMIGVGLAVVSALLLCHGAHRPHVLALTLLNPVTVVHLIGGVHLDAMLAGLIGLSLLALHRRRLWLACVLAVLAAAVKVTVLPLLLFVLLALWRSGRPRDQVVWGGAALLALPYALVLPLVPRPWGFLSALGVPGSSPPWYAPATVLGRGLEGLAWLLGLPVDQPAVHLTGRVVAVLLGSLAVALLWRADLRDQVAGRSDRSVRRAGTALLLVALCLPALYAWYLAAGLFVAAATTGRSARVALVALSSALAFSSLPPLYGATLWPLVVTALAVLALLGVGLASTMSRGPVRPHAGIRPTATTSTSSPHDGPAPYRRLRVTSVGLLVAVALGSVAGSAGADSDPELLQQASQKMRLVTFLQKGYPKLQVVALESLPERSGRYQAKMVLPGRSRCDLELYVAPGPRSQPTRVDLASAPPRAPPDTPPAHAQPPELWFDTVRPPNRPGATSQAERPTGRG